MRRIGKGTGRMENASQKKRSLSALIGLVGLTSPAAAAVITFDPDGGAPANGPQAIAGLDWAVGNALGDQFSEPSQGASFQQLYQATLAGVIDTDGLTVAPVGINSTFELTAVLNVRETITIVA